MIYNKLLIVGVVLSLMWLGIGFLFGTQSAQLTCAAGGFGSMLTPFIIWMMDEPHKMRAVEQKNSREKGA